MCDQDKLPPKKLTGSFSIPANFAPPEGISTPVVATEELDLKTEYAAAESSQSSRSKMIKIVEVAPAASQKSKKPDIEDCIKRKPTRPRCNPPVRRFTPLVREPAMTSRETEVHEPAKKIRQTSKETTKSTYDMPNLDLF